MSEHAGETAEHVPWSGSNPCPDCKIGTCHRCGEDKPDALPGPHMGVVLCSDCFWKKLT